MRRTRRWPLLRKRDYILFCSGETLSLHTFDRKRLMITSNEVRMLGAASIIAAL